MSASRPATCAVYWGPGPEPSAGDLIGQVVTALAGVSPRLTGWRRGIDREEEIPLLATMPPADDPLDLMEVEADRVLFHGWNGELDGDGSGVSAGIIINVRGLEVTSAPNSVLIGGLHDSEGPDALRALVPVLRPEYGWAGRNYRKQQPQHLSPVWIADLNYSSLAPFPETMGSRTWSGDSGFWLALDAEAGSEDAVGAAAAAYRAYSHAHDLYQLWDAARTDRYREHLPLPDLRWQRPPRTR